MELSRLPPTAVSYECAAERLLEAIDAKGLATCTVQKLESTLAAEANAKYGKALIGEGKVSAEITFPAWSAALSSALLREGCAGTEKEKPAKLSLPEASIPSMVL